MEKNSTAKTYIDVPRTYQKACERACEWCAKGIELCDCECRGAAAFRRAAGQCAVKFNQEISEGDTSINLIPVGDEAGGECQKLFPVPVLCGAPALDKL